MRYLNFSHNPLNNIGATAFVKLFFDFETRIVDLQLSCLDGALEFALELARVISDGNLPNLERCDVSKNSIGRQGCERLMESFEQNTSPRLRSLNLSVCTLSDSGVSLICLAMRAGVFRGLEALDVSANSASTSLVFVAEVLKAGCCPALR